MKITVYSKKVLEDKLSRNLIPTNTAILSFYGSYEEPVNIPWVFDCLELQIDDLRNWDVMDPNKFHIEEFRNAAKFVIDNYEQGKDIICQCQAGYSRSAGAAMAISEFFFKDGIKYFSDYLYSPNPIFFNNLYNCLIEESKNREESDKNKKLQDIVDDLFENHSELMESLAKGGDGQC